MPLCVFAGKLLLSSSMDENQLSRAPVHAKQLRTYLKLMDLKLGLLINFNVNLIKEGITRVVNNL